MLALFFAGMFAVGLAVGIGLTMLYLADSDERDDFDEVWADFLAHGVQPRVHHQWRPRGW